MPILPAHKLFGISFKNIRLKPLATSPLSGMLAQGLKSRINQGCQSQADFSRLPNTKTVFYNFLE